MRVFLDFEASSLGKTSYPIEVAWVFEDGTSESHLIRPAPGWDDWAAEAEAIHHIDRAHLLAEGVSHDVVAARMVACLAGHDLFASAPSWDGKWMSTLFRAAGLPRHILRLRGSDEARRSTIVALLKAVVAPEALAATVEEILALPALRPATHTPAHRALADAEQDRARWLAARAAAEELVASLGRASTSADGMDQG